MSAAGARTVWESPLGPLTLVGSAAGALSALRFPGSTPTVATVAGNCEPFREAIAQLEDYFGGRRRRFTLDLARDGTAFEREVWDRLCELPYATTISYGELAARVGRPDRVRAVAGAVARTPVPIVIPCHRVVASDGSLTGYLGGLERKAALLSLEKEAFAGGTPEPPWAFRQEALAV